MTQKFSIHFTKLEAYLMEHITVDVADWLQNMVDWRVRIAEDAFLPQATQAIIDSGATHLPATREEIILAAPNMLPKDPNWEPMERDLPNDDRVEYEFELADDEIKTLEWMWENPHQHIHDMAVERAQIGIKEKADYIRKELLADPTWTDPIPLDPEALIDLVHLKSAAQHKIDSSAGIEHMIARMAEEPGYVPPAVPFVIFKHHPAPEQPWIDPNASNP
jgi:hypothetical protein